MSRLTRDGTAEPVSRDQILRHARGQGNIIFPVQLTTSRIGNLTRLIHTLLYVMTIHIVYHYNLFSYVPSAFLPDILMLTQAPIAVWFDSNIILNDYNLFISYEVCCIVFCFLKKNQNAPRLSEHPPVKGENMSKRLQIANTKPLHGI